MQQIFKPGKITFLMDGQAGSSGKARTASYLLEKFRHNYTFVANTFSANAAHWVKLGDGRKFLYKALNSNAYDHTMFEKMYIGPGAEFDLDTLLQEIEENKIPAEKIGISPMAVIVQDLDANYELGINGFDGDIMYVHEGTMKHGSTCSGVGAAAARRLLRRPSTRLAKDELKLQQYLCNVSDEILQRLDKGESGFQEIAQGYQLSLMYERFFPYVTYRNVTVSQALSDMFLPPRCAGPVILNYRTFPIRINSNKYINKDTGEHLTWDEIQSGIPHSVYEGNSGGWYPDQKELTWESVTRDAGYPHLLQELTSKTKLPRRVANFSQLNLMESMRNNDTGQGVFLTLNFADYVDYRMAGVRSQDLITQQFKNWLEKNFNIALERLLLIGTGPLTEDCIEYSP